MTIVTKKERVYFGTKYGYCGTKKTVERWRGAPTSHTTSQHPPHKNYSPPPSTMTSNIIPVALDVDDDDDDEDDDDVDAEDDAVWYAAARDIQNRVSRVVGTADMEDRLFRSFFGTSIGPTMMVWDLLVHHDLLPDNGRPKHLLWALYFLKVYPKQGPGCSVVGGCAGAVDPKTFRKWVWSFIRAIAELEDELVSNFFYSQCEDDGAECWHCSEDPSTGRRIVVPQTTLPSTQLRELPFFSPPRRPHTPPRRRLLRRSTSRVERKETS